MIHEQFKHTDLFTFETIEEFKFPFNIKFNRIYKKPISGPAIYIISLNGNVIYLGSYKKDKDIISARWNMHIQTNTCRGIKVGFGNHNRFEKMYRPLFEQNGIELDTRNRLKDTGVVTAENKVKFCMNNWSLFKEFDNNLNLSFHLFKPSADTTEKFIKKINAIEMELIKTINPPSNKQFNQNQKTIGFNEAKNIVSKALSL